MKVQYLGVNVFDAIRSSFQKSPIFLVFSPTSKCNASCRHCFNWKNVKNAKTRDELSLKEIEKISKNLGNIKYLTITGGEPFLRDDLSKIIKVFFVNNKIKMLAVHTNGSQPRKISERVEEILKICPELNIKICISIDALFDKHDKIRNKKDSFKEALKTIEMLKVLERKYKNLSLRSVGCLSKLNIKDILKTHTYLEEKVGISHGTALMRGDVREYAEVSTQFEDYEQMYKEVKQYYRKKLIKNYPVFYFLRNTVESLKPKVIIKMLRKKKIIYPCKAGKKVIVLMDNGDIYPCELFNKVEMLGNIKDFNYNLYKLLESPKSKNIIKNIKKCWCTWECIIPINLIFNIKAYPLILREYLKIILGFYYYSIYKIMKKGNK